MTVPEEAKNWTKVWGIPVVTNPDLGPGKVAVITVGRVLAPDDLSDLLRCHPHAEVILEMPDGSRHRVAVLTASLVDG